MNEEYETQIEFAKANDPQASDVYVNQLAPNFVISYFQTQGGLYDLFAELPVDLQGGQYTKWSRADTMRAQTELVAPGAAFPTFGMTPDTSPTYFCPVYGGRHEHTPEMLANYRLPGSAVMAASKFLARAAYLKRERLWTSANFTTSIWGTDATPTVTWDDPSSDPIGDIETGRRAILLATGYEANVLGLGYDVWIALKKHPDILARVGTGGSNNVDPRLVTPRLVAALFELDEIRVGSVVYNTAAPGLTASMAFTAGKNALLVHRTKSPSIEEPSAGYRFSWRGLVGGGNGGISFRNGVNPETEVAWYRIKHADDFRVTASELGYFFNGAVA